MSQAPVLEVQDLHVWFDLGQGRELNAVQGASLTLARGERMGLVGESGCGKTTLSLALMGLLPPNASVAGHVLLDGVDILAGGEDTLRPHRWRDIAMVFQGAMNAFNPVKRIGSQIVEAMELHDVASGRARAGPLRRAARAGRHPRRARAPLPARVLGRHASARRDCDGARLPAARAARRRADHGARRDGAGADPAAPARGSRTSSGSRSSSSRTICRSSRRPARRPPSCTPAASPSSAPPSRSTTPRGIPTPACCSRPRPISTGTAGVASIPGAPPRLDRPLVACPFAPRCDSVFATCRERRPPLLPVGEAHLAACHLAASAT